MTENCCQSWGYTSVLFRAVRLNILSATQPVAAHARSVGARHTSVNSLVADYGTSLLSWQAWNCEWICPAHVYPLYNFHELFLNITACSTESLAAMR
eukprot:1158954-Pelagomonas_calceolata.AAC.6